MHGSASYARVTSLNDVQRLKPTYINYIRYVLTLVWHHVVAKLAMLLLRNCACRRRSVLHELDRKLCTDRSICKRFQMYHQLKTILNPPKPIANILFNVPLAAIHRSQVFLLYAWTPLAYMHETYTVAACIAIVIASTACQQWYMFCISVVETSVMFNANYCASKGIRQG